MRKMIVIAIAAAGVAFAAVPAASAAPLYGTGPAGAATAIDSTVDVHYRGHYRHRHHHHRHCWWRHGRKICRW